MSVTPTNYVLDANILVRLANASDPDHNTAQAAVKVLRSSGAQLRTLPQTFFEFWVVATRAQGGNGLGLSPVQAEYLVDLFARVYWPIPDDPAMLNCWRRLVVRYGVVGKNGHDARYIASMQAHGLTHILTFDSDFNRYTPEGIAVIHPGSVSVAP